jgi:hypothetical protein
VFDCACNRGFQVNGTECAQCQIGKYRNISVNIGLVNGKFLSSHEINLARACCAGGCPVTTNANFPGYDPPWYSPMFVTDGDLNNFHHTHGQ